MDGESSDWITIAGYHWHGRPGIRIHAEALRRPGPHPDQPTAAVPGPTPPLWWHVAAEYNAHPRFR